MQRYATNINFVWFKMVQFDFIYLLLGEIVSLENRIQKTGFKLQ